MTDSNIDKLNGGWGHATVAGVRVRVLPDPDDQSRPRVDIDGNCHVVGLSTVPDVAHDIAAGLVVRYVPPNQITSVRAEQWKVRWETDHRASLVYPLNLGEQAIVVRVLGGFARPRAEAVLDWVRAGGWDHIDGGFA